MKIWMFVLVAMALVSAAQAEVLTGAVVGVTDGDTVTVLDAGKNQHKIRLAGIDAPEKAQPWGQRSKEALSDIVYRRIVNIDWYKADRYGRKIGNIVLDGKDINLSMVVQGMAWHYKAYTKEQSPEDQERYAAAEDAAKASRTGLWADASPVPPWDWRKSLKTHRTNQ